MRIGELFIQYGLISQTQLEEALDLQKSRKEMRIGIILKEMGIISTEDLLQCVKKYMHQKLPLPKEMKDILDQEEINEVLGGWDLQKSRKVMRVGITLKKMNIISKEDLLKCFKKHREQKWPLPEEIKDILDQKEINEVLNISTID